MAIWKNIFNGIDYAICVYLGLGNEETTKPNSVAVYGDKVAITSTNSFRRFLCVSDWATFSDRELKKVSSEEKEKLGMALGKALADNLIVSFDQASVNEGK